VAKRIPIFQAVSETIRLSEILERTFIKHLGLRWNIVDLLCDFFELYGIEQWIRDNDGWEVSVYMSSCKIDSPSPFSTRLKKNRHRWYAVAWI